MVDLGDWVVKARALAQTHPFRPPAYRYMKAAVQQEREIQPADELAEWAGYALTVGYCLRAVEEDTGGRQLEAAPAGDLPADLDGASTHVAALLRTDGAEPYLLSEEALLVDALDRMIGGEIERRLGELEGLDAAAEDELEDYLAWWVIKGYALRTVEPLVAQPHPASS